MKLWNEDMEFRGAISPVFYSRSGEILEVPPQFRWAVAVITAGMCCVGCQHCHLLQANATSASSSSAVWPATAVFEP
jgi:roadblock/LC7 domain-containing protein